MFTACQPRLCGRTDTSPSSSCSAGLCAIWWTRKAKAVRESLALLTEKGINVKTQDKLLHRYAVIDRSVIWYGNIEYLSYSMKDANALRFESPDTAGELLDLWSEVDEPEQLCIE